MTKVQCCAPPVRAYSLLNLRPERMPLMFHIEGRSPPQDVVERHRSIVWNRLHFREPLRRICLFGQARTASVLRVPPLPADLSLSSHISSRLSLFQLSRRLINVGSKHKAAQFVVRLFPLLCLATSLRLPSPSAFQSQFPAAFRRSFGGAFAVPEYHIGRNFGQSRVHTT